MTNVLISSLFNNIDDNNYINKDKNDYNNYNIESNNNGNSANDNYEKQKTCSTKNVACPLVVQV